MLMDNVTCRCTLGWLVDRLAHYYSPVKSKYLTICSGNILNTDMFKREQQPHLCSRRELLVIERPL